MTATAMCTITLHNRSKSKGYQYEVVREEMGLSGAALRLHGVPLKFNGKPGVKSDFGEFTEALFRSQCSSMLAKGYELVNFNGKPLVSNDMDDVVSLIASNGNWGGLPTAQPNRRIRPRDVMVTFDDHQTAPIW